MLTTDVTNQIPNAAQAPQPEEQLLMSPPEVSDEDVARALENLLKDARNEDRIVRWEYLRVWRRLEFYWNNILDIFLDPVSNEWRVPNWDELEGETPPRIINIYRPNGEAIVAALSVAVPSVIFHPDDADNPDDIEAAKAYKSIVDLLEQHNNASMLLIRLVVIMFNQGTVFGYNYYHTNPRFGTLQKPKIEFADINIFEAYCATCGEPLDAGPITDVVPNQLGGPQASYQCPVCGNAGHPIIRQGIESLPQIVGYDESPKGCVSQELFSGLQVKVPQWAKKQQDCGYLLLEFVQSAPMLRAVFQDKADKISGNNYDVSWEQFQKLPLQYYDKMPDNACNVSCIWLRPYQYWQLGSQQTAVIAELTKRYPSGCYAIFVDDNFMEAYEEDMDEHWTITNNPMGTSVYARPIGENLSTIQDMRGTLVEIQMQTAEHGISETFVDPQTVDFNKYGQTMSRPGMLTQAKPKPGKSLADSFFSTRPAILSQEVGPLKASMDEDAQFVTGAFPSIYGAPTPGGSKTASEYSQSRAMALQRLGTVWKVICEFWADFQSRSAIEFAKELKELGQDERFTKREGNNNFVNVWIRSTSLTGNIGRVEPEASEQLPTSWAQKKDAISQLLTVKVPEIMAVLTHPNNAEILQEATGLTDLYIPGEEDRTRQFKEFQILSQGIPVPTNPFDNDAIHAAVVASIMEGPAWDELSPDAKNVTIQHWQEHTQKAQSMIQKPVPKSSISWMFKAEDLAIPEVRQIANEDGMNIPPAASPEVSQLAIAKNTKPQITRPGKLPAEM